MVSSSGSAVSNNAMINSGLQKINVEFGEFFSKVDSYLNGIKQTDPQGNIKYPNNWDLLYDENIAAEKLAKIQALSSRVNVEVETFDKATCVHVDSENISRYLKNLATEIFQKTESHSDTYFVSNETDCRAKRHVFSQQNDTRPVRAYAPEVQLVTELLRVSAQIATGSPAVYITDQKMPTSYGLDSLSFRLQSNPEALSTVIHKDYSIQPQHNKDMTVLCRFGNPSVGTTVYKTAQPGSEKRTFSNKCPNSISILVFPASEQYHSIEQRCPKDTKKLSQDSQASSTPRGVIQTYIKVRDPDRRQ